MDNQRIASELVAVAKDLTAADSRLLKRDVFRVNMILSDMYGGVRELNGLLRGGHMPEGKMLEKTLNSVSDAKDALDDAGDAFQKLQREIG
jgi:hypothetical protein